METSLLNRVQATLLALATAALFVLAVLNLLEQRQFPQPDDGVWWGEAAGGLHAEKVLPDKPGQRAGIQVGDLLTGVSDSPASDVTPVTLVAGLERALYAAGPYGQVYYTITRDGIPLETPVKVIPEPLDRSLEFGLRIIGLIYLIIGFYVLFRRWGAPRATHFYLFCLVSFALYALKYTSKLDTLDWIVFWTNVVAEALQPALFLHFALSFPEERFKNLRRRWLLPLIYAPGAGMLALWLWSIGTREATKLLLDRLYQIDTAYDAVFYVCAALLFLRSYSRATTPLLRQQLKWVTRGTLLAVLPFTFFYAVPYLLHLNPPQLLTNLAGLSLVFLPLTFAWAIVRYRLMDTDLIFKRGVAYTLATALILGGYFGIIALIAEVVHERLPETMREWALIIAILVTAAVFVESAWGLTPACWSATARFRCGRPPGESSLICLPHRAWPARRLCWICFRKIHASGASLIPLAPSEEWLNSRPLSLWKDKHRACLRWAGHFVPAQVDFCGKPQPRLQRQA